LERRSGLTPIDPDTLVAAQPRSRTHSIIDMVNGVSAELAFGTVSPLAADSLMYTFGTVTPSASQVEAWMTSDIAGERDRWVGTYIISYHDGRPRVVVTNLYIHNAVTNGEVSPFPAAGRPNDRGVPCRRWPDYGRNNRRSAVGSPS
jgi:hypothetical protein